MVYGIVDLGKLIGLLDEAILDKATEQEIRTLIQEISSSHGLAPDPNAEVKYTRAK